MAEGQPASHSSMAAAGRDVIAVQAGRQGRGSLAIARSPRRSMVTKSGARNLAHPPGGVDHEEPRLGRALEGPAFGIIVLTRVSDRADAAQIAVRAPRQSRRPVRGGGFWALQVRAIGIRQRDRVQLGIHIARVAAELAPLRGQLGIPDAAQMQRAPLLAP